MTEYLKPNAKVNAVEESYSDLDALFVAHPITGDIMTKKDTDAIKRSVRNIVLTNKFERPFKPNFGASLRDQLFELRTERSKEKFAKRLAETIELYEPRVYNVKIGLNDEDTNEMNVRIFYTIRNASRAQNIELTVSRVR